MWPLHLPGPEFLWVYVCLVTAAALLGLFTSRLVRSEGRLPWRAEELGPLELAYLQRGGRGVLEAALASLHQRGVVGPGLEKGEVRRVLPSAEDVDELEELVFRSIHDSGSTSLSTLEPLVEAACEPMRESLLSRGLLVEGARAFFAQWAAAIFLTPIMAIGGVKLVTGLGDGRPVGFLAITLILSVLAYNLTLRPPIRTVEADLILAGARHRHASLKETARSSHASLLDPGDVAMIAALFGVVALASPHFVGLSEAFSRPSSSESSFGAEGGGGGGGCGGCGGSGG
jgi:uncharacterized protein (TIGR04222 family)